MNRKTLLYIMIACIHSFIMPLNQSNAESGSMDDKIVMDSTREETSADGKAFKLIYTEAFKRMSKTLVYRYFPAKRGSLMADNEEHPNLIRVERLEKSDRD